MNIAFVGKMRSGKDEAASYIISKYGGKNMKFADPLYEMEAAIFNIANIAIPEDKTKRRRLLQFLGTEWGRETIDPNLWANIMDHRLNKQKFMSDLNQILVTDCRFPNEVDILRKNWFYIVKIERPQQFRIEYGATNENHPSETALDDYEDYDVKIINNINDIKAYHNTVDDVYQELMNATFKKGTAYVTGPSGLYL